MDIHSMRNVNQFNQRTSYYDTFNRNSGEKNRFNSLIFNLFFSDNQFALKKGQVRSNIEFYTDGLVFCGKDKKDLCFLWIMISCLNDHFDLKNKSKKEYTDVSLSQISRAVLSLNASFKTSEDGIWLNLSLGMSSNIDISLILMHRNNRFDIKEHEQ